MRVLFLCGGTLGSVTPLLAVAEELDRKFQIPNSKFQIRFWGTRHGPERLIIEGAGMSFTAIPAGKFRRYWDVRNIVDPFAVLAAVVVSFITFLRWRPDVVVGAGSYVQVPVMWAAWVLRIPIAIHQQDARAGFANRLVAHAASLITTTFAETAAAFGSRAVVVGNPVRSTILAARDIAPRDARRRFGIAEDRPTVLVLGGGTGARAINELVMGALPMLLEFANVIHVTGKEKGKDVGMSNVQCPMSNYRSFELLADDLPFAYAAADLVVSRAGMGTITELVALGKAAVLMPMPGTHQEENAAVLGAAGAALVWNQPSRTAPQFAADVHEILRDADQLQRLRTRCAEAFSVIGVAGVLAERIAALARNRGRC